MTAVEASPWIDVDGAAAIAGVHPETIRDALRAGDLHGVQRVKGGRWRMRAECIDAWIEGVRCAHHTRSNVTPFRRVA